MVHRTTIDDVAALAGVSIKTVSRVLNREPRVRDSTRERVELAIRELRYSPNSSARKLAGNRTYLLGLIYSANSSFVTRIQNGALEACRAEHYDLLIHPCRYTDPALLGSISDLVTAPKVDGLLLIPPVSDLPEVGRLMDELRIPNVVVSRESTSDSEWSVGTNDEDVCVDMVEHLYRLGHQRIAFVLGHPDHRAMANRYKGFVRGMKNAGLGVDESLVVQGRNTFPSGMECGRTLLDRAERPTAVFCANDHMAAGVMRAAHERGLAIPRDLSVAGYDDIPLANQVWPALTTIHQPLREMARIGTRLLIGRLRAEKPNRINPVVPASLAIRDSTGPCSSRR